MSRPIADAPFGLDGSDVLARRAEHGPDILPEAKGSGVLARAWRQLITEPMYVLLLAAATLAQQQVQPLSRGGSVHGPSSGSGRGRCGLVRLRRRAAVAQPVRFCLARRRRLGRGGSGRRALHGGVGRGQALARRAAHVGCAQGSGGAGRATPMNPARSAQQMVDPGGIEPPSASHHRTVLHA
jgi:Cation transporter/ATPase, N-terminus